MKPNHSSVKREQKTALFLREISSLIQNLSQDEPKLSKIYVSRVELSKDYKICYVYFSTYTDKKDFDEALEILKLYKPSLRRALAQVVVGKYTADLKFLYDESKEKERRMHELLDKIAQEQESDKPK
jgi:ribosome-binding factor A